jgi:hypothetical protein
MRSMLLLRAVAETCHVLPYTQVQLALWHVVDIRYLATGTPASVKVTQAAYSRCVSSQTIPTLYFRSPRWSRKQAGLCALC